MAAPIIYHYHPVTFVYKGSSEARRSPADVDEVYLFPKNSTTVSPGEVPEGQRAVWNGESWDLEPLPAASSFTVTTSDQFCESVLITELEEANGEVVCFSCDMELESVGEKEITFELEDTQENRDMVGAVLAAHTYPDSVMVEVRLERDTRLTNCDWVVLRHLDQTELVVRELLGETSLSDAQYQEWLVYRQALRDLPANTPDPTNPTWPTPPE